VLAVLAGRRFLDQVLAKRQERWLHPVEPKTGQHVHLVLGQARSRLDQLHEAPFLGDQGLATEQYGVAMINEYRDPGGQLDQAATLGETASSPPSPCVNSPGYRIRARAASVRWSMAESP
jgi:hypothetical protein